MRLNFDKNYKRKAAAEIKAGFKSESIALDEVTLYSIANTVIRKFYGEFLGSSRFHSQSQT